MVVWFVVIICLLFLLICGLWSLYCLRFGVACGFGGWCWLVSLVFVVVFLLFVVCVYCVSNVGFAVGL